MASKLGTKGKVDGQSFTWVKAKNSNALVRKFDTASPPKTSKRPKARPKPSTKTTVVKSRAPKTSVRPRAPKAPSTMSKAPTAPKQAARKSGAKVSSTSRIKTPGKDAMVVRKTSKQPVNPGASTAADTGTMTTKVSRAKDPAIARGSSKPSTPNGYSGYKQK